MRKFFIPWILIILFLSIYPVYADTFYSGLGASSRDKTTIIDFLGEYLMNPQYGGFISLGYSFNEPPNSEYSYRSYTGDTFRGQYNRYISLGFGGVTRVWNRINLLYGLNFSHLQEYWQYTDRLGFIGNMGNYTVPGISALGVGMQFGVDIGLTDVFSVYAKYDTWLKRTTFGLTLNISQITKNRIKEEKFQTLKDQMDLN